MAAVFFACARLFHCKHFCHGDVFHCFLVTVPRENVCIPLVLRLLWNPTLYLEYQMHWVLGLFICLSVRYFCFMLFFFAGQTGKCTLQRFRHLFNLHGDCDQTQLHFIPCTLYTVKLNYHVIEWFKKDLSNVWSYEFKWFAEKEHCFP